MRSRLLWTIASALSLIACGGDPVADAGTDASSDAGSDAGEGRPDGGRPDAGFDGGADAGSDGGTDAGPFDGGPVMGVTFPPRDFVCTPGAPQPCFTTVPLRSDAERTVEVTRDMPTATRTYVVRTLALPEASPFGTAAGLNLDGMDSGSGSIASDATCEEFSEDFTSVRDPGHVGVDNAFQMLIGTMEGLSDAASCPGMTTDGCVDALLAQGIADGTLLILVELTGVDSYVNDEAVEVALYAGGVPGGGPPILDASGVLALGQTFDTVAALVPPTPGDIFEGRVRVAWTGTMMLPSVPALLAPVRLDGPELRADVALGRLSLGVLSATSTVDSIVLQTGMIVPGIEDTMRAVLESIADIRPTSDPAVCADLSVGYVLDAIHAIRR